MRSFVQNPEAAVAAPTTETTAAPQPAANTTTDVARYSPGGFVQGSVDRSDIKTPFLSCVQNVGPKAQQFSPGALVLGDAQIAPAPALREPTAKMRVLFCNARKEFVESLPYNPAPGSPRPKVFNTEEAVRSVGGTTEWHGSVPPTYIKKLTCLILIKSPAGLDDPQFSLIDGDSTFAPAFVSFQKTSYPAAKTLLTDLSLSLKYDPTGTFYDLFWEKLPKGPNFVWCAKIVRVRDEKPSATLTEMAVKLSGNGSTVADETD